MNKERCKVLVDMYKDYRSLWDPKDKNYFNKVTREDSWRQISIALEMNVNEMKAKMKSLMGTYRREKLRQKQSQITGSGKDSVYVTKWFAFDWFTFLSDRDNPNETVDTLPEKTEEHTVNTDVNSQANVEENIQTEDAATNQDLQAEVQAEPGKNDPKKRQIESVNTHSVQAKKKKRAKSNSAIKDPILKTAFEMLQKCGDSNKDKSDSYSVYGEHIANELRKYDPRTLAFVKQAINNIIFEADIGNISVPRASYFS